jgi:hypothetical protein
MASSSLPRKALKLRQASGPMPLRAASTKRSWYSLRCLQQRELVFDGLFAGDQLAELARGVVHPAVGQIEQGCSGNGSVIFTFLCP